MLTYLDNEENAQDFYEIVEFVRIGVLFIQETLQPSKQDFISPDPTALKVLIDLIGIIPIKVYNIN